MTSSLLCSRALGPEQLANDLTSDKKILVLQVDKQ